MSKILVLAPVGVCTNGLKVVVKYFKDAWYNIQANKFIAMIETHSLIFRSVFGHGWGYETAIGKMFSTSLSISCAPEDSYQNSHLLH